MYCVKCKRVTGTVRNGAMDIQTFASKNERPMIRGKCVVCGKTKTQFVQNGGDLASSLSAATSGVKLPWAKFPGEILLVGHSFTGPGTNLDKRLNPDGTPKLWSMPVNKVDEAAYHHDLAYDKHGDTASRNVADKKMIDRLNSIPNPTVRERAERAFVKPILATKARFGLGFKKPPKNLKI